MIIAPYRPAAWVLRCCGRRHASIHPRAADGCSRGSTFGTQEDLSSLSLGRCVAEEQAGVSEHAQSESESELLDDESEDDDDGDDESEDDEDDEEEDDDEDDDDDEEEESESEDSSSFWLARAARAAAYVG